MSDLHVTFQRSASAPAPERGGSVGRRKHFSDGGTLNLFKPFTPDVRPSGRRRSVSPRCSLVSTSFVADNTVPRSPRKAAGTAARRDTADLLSYHEAPVDTLLPAATNRSPRPSVRAAPRSPSNGKSPRNQSTSWITNPFEDTSWSEVKREKPRRQSTILSVWVNNDRDTLDNDRPRCQMSPQRKTRIQTRNVISGEGLPDTVQRVSRRRSCSRNEDEISTLRVLSPSMLPKSEVKRRSRSLGDKMEQTHRRGPSPSCYFNGGMSDAGSRPTSPSPYRRTTFCKEDGTPLPSPSPRMNPHDRYVKGKFDYLRYRTSSIVDPAADDSSPSRKRSLPFVPSFMTDGIASRPYGMSPADPVNRFKTSTRDPYKEKHINKKGGLNKGGQDGLKTASCIPRPKADAKAVTRKRDSSSIPVSKPTKATSRKGSTTNSVSRKSSMKAATWRDKGDTRK